MRVRKLCSRIVVAGTVAGLVVGLSSGADARTVQEGTRRSDNGEASTQAYFTSRSNDLLRINAFAHVSRANIISFDETGAKRAGLTKNQLQFGRQLVAFSNDVVQQGLAPSSSAIRTELDLAKYPLVKRYMAAATLAERAAATVTAREGAPLSTTAIVPQFGDNWHTYSTCGSFWSPRPTVAKSWVRFNVSNPVGTLYAWGYHPPPSGMQWLGWTRPQTYAWWVCGWNTFRDNANPGPGFVVEQNYHGWAPRGEPNPELWASGPWPYATWPSYVYWWHQTR